MKTYNVLIDLNNNKKNKKGNYGITKLANKKKGELNVEPCTRTLQYGELVRGCGCGWGSVAVLYTGSFWPLILLGQK